jgi:NAD(P) transhydrogenase
VVGREIDVVRSQLSRNRVTILIGTGYFVDEHTIEVDDGQGRTRRATAEKIVIATGTRPARPKSVDFDERTVIDSPWWSSVTGCSSSATSRWSRR